MNFYPFFQFLPEMGFDSSFFLRDWIFEFRLFMMELVFSFLFLFFIFFLVVVFRNVEALKVEWRLSKFLSENRSTFQAFGSSFKKWHDFSNFLFKFRERTDFFQRRY